MTSDIIVKTNTLNYKVVVIDKFGPTVCRLKYSTKIKVKIFTKGVYPPLPLIVTSFNYL